MDSLQLPEDLVWNGKMEPISPPTCELFPLSSGNASWIFEDSFQSEILLYDDNSCNSSELFDQQQSPVDGELLFEFEYESDIKKEQWYDGKPLNQQTEYPSPVVQQPSLITKVQNPYEIILDLGQIYNPTELTQLTPPQTPPQDAHEVKEIFDLISQHQQQSSLDYVTNSNDVVEDIVPALSPASSCMDYSSEASNSPITDDIAREMQIVDDILRTRAKDLPDWNEDNDSQYSLGSSSLSQSHDDDWSPSSPSVSSSFGSPGGSVGKIIKDSKKRTRPYGRGMEERKSRKKEQNKNAATRYRQKKKEEMKVILDEEHILASRNEELSKTVSEVEREVKYLKKLIKEFYKNKI